MDHFHTAREREQGVRFDNPLSTPGQRQAEEAVQTVPLRHPACLPAGNIGRNKASAIMGQMKFQLICPKMMNINSIHGQLIVQYTFLIISSEPFGCLLFPPGPGWVHPLQLQGHMKQAFPSRLYRKRSCLVPMRVLALFDCRWPIKCHWISSGS